MLMQPNTSKKIGKASKGLGRRKGHRGHREVLNGSFGLKALEAGRITARQLEAGRKARRRRLKRQGRVWISVFPDRGVTSKGQGQRMGKGKGSTDYWCARVLPGTVLFEVDGVDESLAMDALGAAAPKLPVMCSAVARDEGLPN